MNRLVNRAEQFADVYKRHSESHSDKKETAKVHQEVVHTSRAAPLQGTQAEASMREAGHDVPVHQDGSYNTKTEDTSSSIATEQKERESVMKRIRGYKARQEDNSNASKRGSVGSRVLGRETVVSRVIGGRGGIVRGGLIRGTVSKVM